MSDEKNDAVRQAEEIFLAEYGKARAEECPQGEECGVHFRVDEEIFLAEYGKARLITYVGEFAVITDDNQEYENPAFIIKAMMGRVKREDLPPRWSTMICHVGEGTVGDLSEKSAEVRGNALRYYALHDEWDAIAGFHSVTVSALRQGLVDVNEPFKLGG